MCAGRAPANAHRTNTNQIPFEKLAEVDSRWLWATCCRASRRRRMCECDTLCMTCAAASTATPLYGALTDTQYLMTESQLFVFRSGFLVGNNISFCSTSKPIHVVCIQLMNMERVMSACECVWHVWPNSNWKSMSWEVIGRCESAQKS